MKSRIIRVSLLSAFALLAPLLTFAGSPGDKLQTQNVNSQTAAVQQRNSRPAGSSIAVNTDVVEIITPRQPVCVVYDKHTCPNWNDGAAFHK